MARLSDYLKNLLYIFILIQLLPFIVMTIRRNYSTLLETRTKVGVVSIKGLLCNASPYLKNIKKLFKDDEIKAILLKIECAGGAAGSAQALYREIIDLKKEHLKPVVVLIENICASGGYYVASPGDAIICSPSAVVGSIGVYIQQPQLKEFIEQFKAKYSVVQSGAYKTAGNPLLDPTPEGQAMLQSISDDTYNQFVHDIAAVRPQLNVNHAKDWANGKVFTGRQALEKGLVDHLGSLTTAEQILRKKAPIEGEIEWVYASQGTGFLQWLSGGDDADDSFSESTAQSLCNIILNRCFSIQA